MAAKQWVCVRDHPATERNTYRHPVSGKRECRECRRLYRANLRAQQQSEGPNVGQFTGASSASRTRRGTDSVEYLRSLVPCRGCGVTLVEDKTGVYYPHKKRCRTQHIPEG